MARYVRMPVWEHTKKGQFQLLMSYACIMRSAQLVHHTYNLLLLPSHVAVPCSACCPMSAQSLHWVQILCDVHTSKCVTQQAVRHPFWPLTQVGFTCGVYDWCDLTGVMEHA